MAAKTRSIMDALRHDAEPPVKTIMAAAPTSIEPPKSYPKRKQGEKVLFVSLPSDMYETLREMAFRKRVSARALTEEALRDLFEKYRQSY